MCENKLTISEETKIRENDYRKMAVYLQEHCCVCRQVQLPDKTSYREILRNTPVLVILGGGHIALFLAKLGKMIGYRIIVVDDRPDFASQERFPEADQLICLPFLQVFEKELLPEYASYVIVTRGHENDYVCLREVLGRTYSYVGMIGSRSKVAFTRKRLLEDGFTEEVLSEIHAPIGLDIGAQTPEEIAVSITAELIQERVSVQQTAVISEILEWLKTKKEAMMMVTLIEKKGSAPRGVGSRLLVCQDGSCAGTIGGGAVEYLAQKHARKLLKEKEELDVRHYDLSSQAAEAGMVCGGNVRVLFERVEAVLD